MRGRSRSRSGNEPGVKVDARSERWREHRKKVRSEIVDAAFRAHRPARAGVVIARDRRGSRHRQAEDLSALHRQVGSLPGDRRAVARHALGRDLPVHQRGHRPRARGDPPQRRAVCAPGRRAPERGAVPDAGPLRRTDRVRDAGTVNEGSRHHAGNGRHVQQRAGREMELDGAAIELAAFATSAPRRRRPTGGWAPIRTARGGCRPTSSSRT